MSAWSPADRRRVGLLAALLLAAGCAEMQPAAPGAVSATRTGPDDSDLWNLAPAAADTVAEVDLVALRTSPWTRALTESGLSGQREESRRAFGYDPFTDGDRLLAAAIETDAQTGGVPRVLVVVRGRFDAGQVGAAFGAANPGARQGSWRDTGLWEAPGRAIALVTPRTLVSGDPADVRGAIDAAWGIVPDARSGPLAELRGGQANERPGPAVFVAVGITDALRARAAEFAALPPGLLRAGARMDLAQDLNLDFAGVADSPGHAAEAARALLLGSRAYAQGTMIRLLGLAPILNGLTVGADGVRIHGHVTVPAEQRERLADKLLALLQMLAAARH